MNLLIEDNKVVGVEDGIVTQLFTRVSNPHKLLIETEIVERLNNPEDSLHASHLTLKNGKIIIPKTIPKSDSITA